MFDSQTQSEPRMKPSIPHVLAAGMVMAAPLLFAQPASAAMFWFPDPASVWGEQVYSLYQILTWLSLGILLVVEVALVAALLKFRKRPNETRQPETWNHNTKLEVIWTVIPFLMLIGILFPTFKAVAYLADVPKKADLTLEIVGHQFYWEYRYPELGVQFNTTPTMGPGTGMEELYLPVGRKIKVVLTAADVIHSWYVPSFGFQQMTTPGNLAMAPLEVTKPGLYEGYCTYLCGPLHGAMRVRVRAVPGNEFDAWVATQTKKTIEPIAKTGKVGQVAPPPTKPAHGAEGEHGAPAPSGSGAPHGAAPGHENTDAAAPVDAKALAAKGEGIYASKCAGCHGAAGAGVPNVFPPLAASDYVNGPDEQFVNTVVKGLNGPITVNGKQYSGMMPGFQGQLSNEELAAVMTYVRTSWGNNGKPITPAQAAGTH